MSKKETMSNEDPMFGFGILGAGFVAGVHAKAIASMKNARLVGVFDPCREAAEKLAEKYGACVYPSEQALLDDAGVDVVCICTPSFAHATQAMAALRHGKHVAVEKPMALNTEEADRVLAVAEESGRQLTVISQLRFSEDIPRAREIVQSGALGKITLCSLYMKYYRSPEYYSSSAWKGKLSTEGGGALMNQGIHGIDLLQYLAGPIVDAQGCVRTLVHDIEVEDSAVATLTMENGALGVIEASVCAYPGFDRRIEIHGDRGYLRLRENRIEEMMLDGKRSDFTVDDGLSSSADPRGIGSYLHAQQLENLLQAVCGKETLLIDGKEGRRSIAVVESIYRSSRERIAKTEV